jgi:hypothetical protein
MLSISQSYSSKLIVRTSSLRSAAPVFDSEYIANHAVTCQALNILSYSCQQDRAFFAVRKETVGLCSHGTGDMGMEEKGSEAREEKDRR